MIFTVPNLLTLLRMGLIPLFIITLVNGEPRKALLVFVVAGVTDALDGFIARFWKQQSLVGSFLDPLADKLLLMSAYVVLSIPSVSHGAPIPLWVTILVITRDVLLVTVALVVFLAVGVRRFPPTILSKINTVFQVVAIVLVLLAGTLPEVRLLDLAAETCLYLVAGLTLASGLDYVYRATQWEKPRPHPPAPSPEGEGETSKTAL